MPDFFSGFTEGFTGEQEKRYQENFAKDAAQRQQESKIYEYLLQSNDPEMRALAMSGMFESARPGSRKKGLRGAMGEIQGSEFYPQVLAHMNQLVPAEPPASSAPTARPPSGAPQPPASAGSAAMSTNQAVRPGAAPIQPTPGPPAVDPEVAEMGGGGAPLGPAGGPPSAEALPPPPPPPESKWKRRGTGVPTAEEIAESSAGAQLRGRANEMVRQLTAAGASPDEIQDMLLGMAGAPRNQRTLSSVAQWGVTVPGSDTVQPVLLDQGKGYVLPGGQPLPAGAKMIRMTGSTGGGVPRSAKEPDQNSSTGWSKVFYDTASGAELYRVDDTPFVAPPQYSGTTTIAEPGSGVPVVAPINRTGGLAPAVGDAPSAVESQTQLDAKALIDIVNKRVAEQRRPGLPVRPGQRDQITAEEATKLQLPFKTYAEAERASRSTPPITKREQSEGGSLAERVRNRALQNRGGGAAAPSVSPTPIPPPPPTIGPARSNRSQGPGPAGR